MKVIKRGDPKTILFQGSCVRCGSVIECTAEEVTFRIKEGNITSCPFCEGMSIYVMQK